MKNAMIPLAVCANTAGEFEPALVPQGAISRQLVSSPEGGLWTKHDHQGFSWRRDLIGLVHRCGGLPIIEIDDGGVFAIQNPDAFIVSGWGKI